VAAAIDKSMNERDHVGQESRKSRRCFPVVYIQWYWCLTTPFIPYRYRIDNYMDEATRRFLTVRLDGAGRSIYLGNIIQDLRLKGLPCYEETVLDVLEAQQFFGSV
jgi:hypothetical protein